VDDLHMGWGAVWLDYNNDGNLDVLVAQGDRWISGAETTYDPIFDSPLNLLQGDGDSFVDVASQLGLDQAGSFRTVVADDWNGDGILDLLATEVIEAPHLYLSQNCTKNSWLRVEAPPQSRVELVADGRTQVGWTTTESSYGGGHSSFLHIGLGDADWVDHLTITDRYGKRWEAGDFPGRRVVRVD
jgi:hypothetical protein